MIVIAIVAVVVVAIIRADGVSSSATVSIPIVVSPTRHFLFHSSIWKGDVDCSNT